MYLWGQGRALYALCTGYDVRYHRAKTESLQRKRENCTFVFQRKKAEVRTGGKKAGLQQVTY